jgi:glycosyltransferase involved in cell wall biosynthesis
MGSYSFSLQIVTCREKKNAAQNRNTAASYLQTDIITFFDADDLMHPQRIDAIHRGFSTHDAYFMVHSFQMRQVYVPYPTYSYHVNQLEVCLYGSTLIKDHAYDMPIANGHCSVLRRILSECAYPESGEDQGREDTVFSARIIQKYPNHTLYCSDALSCYLPSGTGGAC